MGLFEKIFKKSPVPRGTPEGFFKTLTAYAPVFNTWGGAVYESELVRAAIDAKARHISKLEVSVKGTAKPVLQTKLQAGPNEWQTWGQFLYRLSTILDVNNTAFIFPVIGEYGETTGFFTSVPMNYELLQYGGEPWLRVKFYSGNYAAVELRRVGILTKHQYYSDYFGEGNGALTPTMELIHMQNQGITEGVKSAATYRFMARLDNFAKPEDLKKEREQFTDNNLKRGAGVLLFPNTWSDIKQIEAKPFVVDADQMKVIENNVYNYFGVNESVMQSKATPEELDAFYNGAIEPFAIQCADVMTRMIFTMRERNLGSEIVVNSNRLQYMSVANKVNLATTLGDRGMVTINEIRALFNYPAIPDGDRAPVRGEYYFVGEEENASEN